MEVHACNVVALWARPCWMGERSTGAEEEAGRLEGFVRVGAVVGRESGGGVERTHAATHALTTGTATPHRRETTESAQSRLSTSGGRPCRSRRARSCPLYRESSTLTGHRTSSSLRANTTERGRGEKTLPPERPQGSERRARGPAARPTRRGSRARSRSTARMPLSPPRSRPS